MREPAAYERLSSQDATFMMFADRGTPMHISAIGAFAGSALAEVFPRASAL